MCLKISKYDIICFFLFLFLLQSPIAQNTSGIVRMLFSSYDELFAIFVFLYALIKRVGRLHMLKIQKNILECLVLFLVIGACGTVINNLQPAIAVFQDIISCSKFFLVLVGILTLIKNMNINKLMQKMKRMSTIVVTLFFALTVYDEIFRPSFFIHEQKRYGWYCLQLFYYHPAVLAYMMVLLLAIMLYDNANSRKYNKYIIMALIMLCLTFRGKAIGFAFVYLFFWKYDTIKKFKYGKSFFVAIAILGATFLARDSISTYYGSLESSKRGILTLNAIKIAVSHFPFGVGLGTYGSAAAVAYYSPVYIELGYNQIYGLGYMSTAYATDTFWPIIFGEFGFLGFGIFLILLLVIARHIFVDIKEGKRCGLVACCLFIYLAICTTATTGFFNPMAVPYGFLIEYRLLNHGIMIPNGVLSIIKLCPDWISVYEELFMQWLGNASISEFVNHYTNKFFK